MSFENDYKSKMDSIRTDGYIRQKVLNKISSQEEKATKKRKTPLFKAAVAFVCLFLCVMVAIPTISILQTNYGKASVKAKNAKKNVTESTMANAGDYAEIYEKVKDLRALEYSYYTDNLAKGEIAIDEDFAVPESSIDDSETTVDTSGTANDRYSETNNQVDGVDEADIVKTDGKYIYALSTISRKLRIIKAGKNPEVVSEILLKNQNYWSHNMYLHKDRLAVFSTEYTDDVNYNAAYVSVQIYDISDPSKPVLANEIKQDGEYNNSRLIGDKLYLISEYNVNNGKISVDDPATYVPEVYCRDLNGAVPADCVYIGSVCNRLCYTVICGYDITDASLCGTQSILGGTYALYSSTKNIITAGFSQNNETEIARFSIDDGKIELKAQGILNGGLLNQFSIDEYNGYFRFVTTDTTVKETRTDKTVSATFETSNALYVFDGDLKQVGAIENLAPYERVYSVRFMGDTAYFVTFRQVDPLFTADLSDPENPKIVGELKIPGFSTYMHPYGDGLLLGLGRDADEETGRTGNMKLSMFNISDSANVTEQSKKILDVYYSDALDDHKAVLIDVKLNIIGFVGYTDRMMVYVIYGYENGEFVKKTEIGLDTFKSERTRGMFIGDELYIIAQDGVLVYNINTFEKITELNF